ncbi:hypothetical protein J2P12_01970 [Candidatus Bathyarchaeota archaeon]|nr:hypothetical protein [Candidatus Bathyarchaeota archaeon]
MRTKLKIVLPVGKKRAWKYIATPAGLARWLPSNCTGKIMPGESLKFDWRDGFSEQFRVVCVGEKHSSLRLRRRDGSDVRFYLHGKMTTLTLEVGYPKTVAGRNSRVSELPLWGFRLANLKSVALGGPDLRHQLRGRTWRMGFVD